MTQEPKVVISKEEITRMMRTRQYDLRFPNLCWLCPVDAYDTLEELKGHIRAEHGQYDINCTICPGVFRSWKELGDHLLKEHKMKEWKDLVRRSRPATTVSSEEFVLIKDKACFVMEVCAPQSGKKEDQIIRITGRDVFTGLVIEDTVSSFEYLEIPKVEVSSYVLYDVEDGYVRLYVDDSGDIKDSIKLPANLELRAKIEEAYLAGYGVSLPSPDMQEMVEAGYKIGSALIVTIISAMGREEISAVKEVVRTSFVLLDVVDDYLFLVGEGESYEPKEDIKLPGDPHLRSLIKAATTDEGEFKVEIVRVDDRDVVMGVRRHTGVQGF